MQVLKETPVKHSILSYDDKHLVINQITYDNSVIVSAKQVEANWPVSSLALLTIEHLTALLDLAPKIIILGHNQGAIATAPFSILQYLSQQRVGIECMSIGAASSTFNVLLSEGRDVVAGFIFG